MAEKKRELNLSTELPFLWLRQESNLDLELRKLLYYPLYYEAEVFTPKRNKKGNLLKNVAFTLRTAYGNRTRYSTVKGWRINRFTNAAVPGRECKYRACLFLRQNFF